jgi:hypothetical protein
MRRLILTVFACVFLLAATPLALAQQGNNPPTIDIIAWYVFHEGDWVTVYDRDLGIGSLSDIDNFIHQELDFVVVVLEIMDADWAGDEDQEGEQYYLRFRTVAWSIGPPEAPPIRQADEDFFGATADEGFAPPPGATVSYNSISFYVPEFLGRNQDRLRGYVDYDTFWWLEFTVSNEEAPENEGVLDKEYVFLQAIEDPFLGPRNPPPFADAGADVTVAAGTQVILNGSRTFDSYNVGFDESDDANIFDKDRLTFTWEWLSGPVRVDPIHDDPRDPSATVTLEAPGEYVYRLLVDDNVSALPSTDSVHITVVEELPVNNPPQAVIRGPANAVPVGSIVTLTSESTDPDGDELEYRWQQTDELGGQLPIEDLQDVFQPLSGLMGDTASWQALKTGTYYFRLLVDDGYYRSSARFSVEVIDSVTSGASAIADSGSTDDTTTSTEQDAGGAALCGAGAIPFAVLPLVLCRMRRRFR